MIGLPQGGGALSGLGEKFSPDLHTGTSLCFDHHGPEIVSQLGDVD